MAYHQGRRLLELLAERNRDQTWLAIEMNLSRQQIHKWTRAESWRMVTTRKIARAFGIDPEYFLRSSEREWPEIIRGGRTAFQPPQLNNRGRLDPRTRGAASQ